MAEPGSKPRVLLVDGDPVAAMHVDTALRHVGWDVLGPASRLPDALRLAEAEPLDAAALDVRLGEETSFPVAERLAARGVPFVFVSAHAGEFPPGPLASAPRLGRPCRVADVLAALARLRDGGRRVVSSPIRPAGPPGAAPGNPTSAPPGGFFPRQATPPRG